MNNDKTKLILSDDEGNEKDKHLTGREINHLQLNPEEQTGKNDPTLYHEQNKENKSDHDDTEHIDSGIEVPEMHMEDSNGVQSPLGSSMQNKSLNQEAKSENTSLINPPTQIIQQSEAEKKQRVQKWVSLAGKALAVASVIGGLPMLYGWTTDLGNVRVPADGLGEAPLHPEGTPPQLATVVNDRMSLEEAFHAARKEVGPNGMFVHQNKVYPTVHPKEFNSMDPVTRDVHAEAIQKEHEEIQNLPVANKLIPMELKVIDEKETTDILPNNGMNSDGKPMDLYDALLIMREHLGPGQFFKFNGEVHTTYLKEEWNSVKNDPELLADYKELIENESVPFVKIENMDSFIVPSENPDSGRNENNSDIPNNNHSENPIQHEVITRGREAVEVKFVHNGVEAVVKTVMIDGKFSLQIPDESTPPKYLNIGFITGVDPENGHFRIQPNDNPSSPIPEPPDEQNPINISIETLTGVANLPLSEAVDFVARSGGDFTLVHGDLSGIQGTAKGLIGNVSHIHGDISGIEGDIGRLEGDVTELTGTISIGEFVSINDVIYEVVRDEEGTPLHLRELSEDEYNTLSGESTISNTISNIPEKIEDIPEQAIIKAGSCYGDVSGVHGDMSKIWGDLSGITGDVSKLSGDVSGISGDVSLISGDVSNIYGDLDGLIGDVSNISGDVSNIDGDVTQLQGYVEDLQGDVSHISGAIHIKTLININDNIYEVSRNQDGFATDLRKLSDVDAEKVDLSENVLNIDLEEGQLPDVTNVGQELIEEYAQDFGLSGDVSNLQGNISGLYGDVSGIGGKVDDLIGYATNISGDVSNLTGNISGIEGTVDRRLNGDVSELYGDVSEIRGYTTNISGDINSISGNVTNLQGDVTNIIGHIDDLSGDVSNIEGDISGIFGDATNIHGDVSNISGDVSNISGDVSGLTHDVSGLTGLVGPVIPPDDYYANQQDSDSERIDPSTNTNNDTDASDGTNGSNNEVESSDNNFHNPEDPSHLDL